MILEMASEIAELERSLGIDTASETYQEEFNFGLMQVVYEWAKGEVSSHIDYIRPYKPLT